MYTVDGVILRKNVAFQSTNNNEMKFVYQKSYVVQTTVFIRTIHTNVL